MRVQLRAGGVADDPEAIRDTQPSVARERRSTGRVDAVALQAEIVDRELTADREQDGVALSHGTVRQVDRVRAVRSAGRSGTDRANTETDRHAVRAQRFGDDRRVARVVRGHQPIAGLDDRHRDPEARVDLRKLTARRPAAEYEEAGWELAGEGRLA